MNLSYLNQFDLEQTKISLKSQLPATKNTITLSSKSNNFKETLPPVCLTMKFVTSNDIIAGNGRASNVFSFNKEFSIWII